ncbi:hypothetical protein MUP01_00635 [Candidatus Bathyarchaeota archaeon]|nr:hypothetical protein [Candidatus Bathyarchaeota archaeon]
MSQKEVQMIEETLKKTGITKYRLFKDALHEYCESRLKKEVEHDGGNPEREPETESGRNAEKGGRGAETDIQGGTQAGPISTTEHGSDLEEYLTYLRATA